MGEAYLTQTPVTDYKLVGYTGIGPLYSGTYTVPLRDIDLGFAPVLIQLLGYTGGSLNSYGQFGGSLMQGQICLGPSNTPYIKLVGNILSVCSWTYTANGGFFFQANDAGKEYRVLAFK